MDLRSTPLSYIFNALFRDTQLGYTFYAQPNIKFLANLAACDPGVLPEQSFLDICWVKDESKSLDKPGNPLPHVSFPELGDAEGGEASPSLKVVHPSRSGYLLLHIKPRAQGKFVTDQNGLLGSDQFGSCKYLTTRFAPAYKQENELTHAQI